MVPRSKIKRTIPSESPALFISIHSSYTPRTTTQRGRSCLLAPYLHTHQHLVFTLSSHRHCAWLEKCLHVPAKSMVASPRSTCELPECRASISGVHPTHSTASRSRRSRCVTELANFCPICRDMCGLWCHSHFTTWVSAAKEG